MTRYIDFKKLKERVSLQQIASRYGWRLREQGDGLMGDCPLCGDDDDATRRFRITPEKGAWKCWSCDEHGNALDLVAKIEDVSLQKAAVLIADWFGVTDCELERTVRKNHRKKESVGEEPHSKAEPSSLETATEADYAGDDSELCVEEEELRRNPTLSFDGLKGLDPTHPSIEEGGITPDLCREFEAGYCSKGMMQGRLAVPIHNAKGQLLAYCGIALDDRDDRLKFPPENKYERGLDLFNLHRALCAPFHETDGLIIVEDILDAFHVQAGGDRHVVATMGDVPTPQHILRLRKLRSPSRQLTVLWKEPSDDLQRVIAELATFTWVHVAYPERNVEIRELSYEELTGYLSGLV